MSSVLNDLGIDRLSVEERLQLVQAIWNSLEADSDDGRFPMTEAQKQEVDRRVALLDADPTAVISWELAEARARARLGT